MDATSDLEMLKHRVPILAHFDWVLAATLQAPAETLRRLDFIFSVHLSVNVAPFMTDNQMSKLVSDEPDGCSIRHVNAFHEWRKVNKWFVG